MKDCAAQRFICASCRIRLDPVVLAGPPGRIDYGVLACRRCATGLPVIAGFVFGAHPVLTEPPPTLADLHALERQLMPRLGPYAETLRTHGARSSDAYAAFQPFNESTRALYPLLEHVRRHLQPGDLILDTWCRTGFSGALLAGLFPQQHVVSLWEGNLGVLGYQGFRHWLGADVRAPNWDIVFAHPGQGLPFDDASFAFVHGLDSLHRYAVQPFLGDCLRTATPRGAIVFPHVHLANSEPEPFFERGGVQRQGLHYRDHLARVLAGGSRRAFVLSEQALFELDGPAPLQDDAQTPHYNGLVAILEGAHADLPLSPAPSLYAPDQRPVRNPLVSVDAASGAVAADREGAADLLARHPCYARRLAQVLPAALTRRQVQAWAWLEAGASWTEVGQRLGWPAEVVQAEALALERAELLATLPIGAAMARLQHFHADRDLAPPLAEQGFAHLWARLAERYADRPVLRAEDGSAFGWPDVEQVVAAMRAVFSARGVGPGARVALVAGPHAEAILAVWACWLCGAGVAPLDPALPAAQRDALIERIAPVLLLIDGPDSAAADPAATSLRCVCQPGTQPGTRPGELRQAVTLGELLADALDGEPAAMPVAPPPGTDDVAAILFTSGSTGQPKGVLLSHGALLRGAATLQRAYGIGADDVLCCPGGLHTMSGLRNNCVLPLLEGSTLAAIDPRHFVHPRAAAAACRRFDVSVLSVVPAFVHALRTAGGGLAFGALRQILCTASTLTLNAQREVEQALGVPIHMYYGLTETGGVCALSPRGSARLCDGDIGVPARASLRRVDRDGQPCRSADETGELEVFSTNLMLGYLDDPAATEARLHDGWLRTGDLARFDDGHFILCGRIDDMVKTRHGLALQPALVEALLCSHEAVAEAVLVAVESPAGARLHLCVLARQPMPDGWDAQLLAWLSTRLGAPFMPERLWVLAQLPRGANGKVARAVLREQLAFNDENRP